jgi:hypothetical protein
VDSLGAKVAITLEVLIGALTTALGAALGGHNVRNIEYMLSRVSMLDRDCDLDSRDFLDDRS